MRLLLDEYLPRPLRHDLPGHEVHTVQQMGWAGTKNGALRRRIASEFDGFITVDQNREYQQMLGDQLFATVILTARRITVEDLRPLMPHVLDALRTIRAGDIVRIMITDGTVGAVTAPVTTVLLPIFARRVRAHAVLDVVVDAVAPFLVREAGAPRPHAVNRTEKHGIVRDVRVEAYHAHMRCPRGYFHCCRT